MSKITKVSVLDKSVVYIYMHSENTKKRAANDILSYHKHYLNKFNNEINILSKKDKSYVIDRHYIEISKAFIKEGRFIKGLLWLIKTSNIFNSIIIVTNQSLKYLFLRRKPNLTP